MTLNRIYPRYLLLITIDDIAVNIIYVINIQFPRLEVKDAVSVSCMDVFYSVRLKEQNVNDESKNDSTVTMALSDAIDDEEEGDYTSLSHHL